jgi:hypothetical protein
VSEPPAPVAYRIWTPLDTLDGDPGFSLRGLNTFPLPNGASVWVREVPSEYRLIKTSTATADGGCIVAPVVGPGRWHRYPAAADGGLTLPWPGSLECGPLTDGAYRETVPAGATYPTGINWYTDATKAVPLLLQTITRNGQHNPSVIVWQAYSEGVLMVTITDTITYEGLVEASRLRSVG